MSTRLIPSLVAVSTSLLLIVGCAAGPDDESAESAESAEGDDGASMPTVETDTVGTTGSGLDCRCPAGQEFQNGLCYRACPAGWSGEGPVCWKPCVSGFTDTGFFCHRNSSIISANTSKCPWYNKCGLGSSCSTCPSGYSKDGCTCRRDAYIYAQESQGRGAGTTPSCSSY
ncbi:MAG: hypothetical protein KF795_21895 [Labilithrix sp.]|nr:hypothetical protein [Labilithrix sp.]